MFPCSSNLWETLKETISMTETYIYASLYRNNLKCYLLFSPNELIVVSGRFSIGKSLILLVNVNSLQLQVVLTIMHCMIIQINKRLRRLPDSYKLFRCWLSHVFEVAANFRNLRRLWEVIFYIGTEFLKQCKLCKTSNVHIQK